MTHQPDPFFAIRDAIAAGAIILANEGRHGRPLNYHVVNAEGREPEFSCEPHEYLAVLPFVDVVKLIDAAKAALPYIAEAGAEFEDDGQNEPLEAFRRLRDALEDIDHD